MTITSVTVAFRVRFFKTDFTIRRFPWSIEKIWLLSSANVFLSDDLACV